jgi:hypothetical protein
VHAHPLAVSARRARVDLLGIHVEEAQHMYSRVQSEAGPIEFKGIQMNTHYFWKKTSIYIHVYSVYIWKIKNESNK